MGCPVVRRIWTALGTLAICLQSAQSQQHVLSIPPVFQTTAVYCWLATGQMVFQYFDIPANNPTLFAPNDPRNYQCGEAKGIGAVPTAIPSGPLSFTGTCWNNCGLPQCMTGSGTIQGIYNLITQYPQIVARTNGNDKFFQHPIEATSALNAAQVKSEIDGGRPIIAGISPGMQFLPPGVSEHAVLIVGYADGGATLIVNDPFPYEAANMMPSYLQAGGQQASPGQFRVSYQAMVGPIAWKNTIYNLQTNGNSQPNPAPQPNGGGDTAPTDALSCTIDATSVPWNPPGTAQVRIDGKSVGGFNFGPGGSSSLDFSCKSGHHRFQFSIPGTLISCTGSFDVDDDNTDFTPSMRVSPLGQVSCSLE
jgi:Peptidase_C39 like family